jgi:ABC-type sulfate transport system substrate-binding protein
MRNPTRLAAAIAMVGVLALGACGGGSADEGGTGSGDGGGSNLSLVAFSVTKSAYDTVTKDFAATDAGTGTTWKPSYGASGDQSRAVVSGLEADYVHFSLEGDVTRLVDEGLVAEDWDSGPTKGIVSNSVVVLVVRKGNPKGIKGWDDIIKPGIGIVSPNPGSSGSARWNILAGYGQVLAEGGTKAEAEDYLTSFFTNVVALPGSGREATTAFTSSSPTRTRPSSPARAARTSTTSSPTPPCSSRTRPR